MNYLSRLISLSLSWSVFAALPSYSAVGSAWTLRTSESTNPKALKILFIGNSMLYWHDVPQVFCNIVKDKNPNQPLKVRVVVGNAYALHDHWIDSMALRTIKDDGPWDFVVLYEQTGIAEDKPEDYEASLQLFDQQIRAAKAQTILVENYDDAPDDQAETRQVYSKFGTKYQAQVIPVGTVWNYVRKHHPEILIYDPDGHHPGSKGTYLIGSLFYSFLGHAVPNPTNQGGQEHSHTSSICSSSEAKKLDNCVTQAAGLPADRNATAPPVVQQHPQQTIPATIPFHQTGVRNY